MANDEGHIEQSANEAAPTEDAALVEQSAPTEDAASNMPRPPDHPEHLPWPPKWRRYPDDHPARQNDWTPEEPFNEDWARKDFGDEFVDRLKKKQDRFRGDWWLLAMLLRCSESAAMADPKVENKERFAYWNNKYKSFVRFGSSVVAHLEHANLRRARLEHADLSEARLEHANLSDARLEHAILLGARLENANLFQARLEHADLRLARLEHADLWSARLEHADLRLARLERADLRLARLERADLRDARLENAELWYARLEHANLSYARLEHANLRDARLEYAILFMARLEHANLRLARLEHANLEGAGFEHANLQHAQLEHAKIHGARLDHADVRGAKGLLFDNNPAERLHIEGNAPDPWSTLRREYTGPRFFFHLLLLVAFLLPYAARVLILSAHSQMYITAKEIARDDPPERTSEKNTREQLTENTTGVDQNSRVEDSSDEEWWRKGVRYGVKKFEEKHDKTPAWWVLVGGNNGWFYVALTAILVVYNGLRALLTSRVSMLRDAEERSKITPSLEDYYGVCHPLANRNKLLEISDKPREASRLRDWLRVWWKRVRQAGWRKLSPVPVIGLYRVHQLARLLFWAAMLSFTINAFAWIATTTVWVPKP